MIEQLDDFVQVELSLIEAQPKRKIKKDLFEIFNDLDINDETDLVLISYGINKPDSVLKIVICFKSKTIAEKFTDYLEIDDNLKRYNLLDIIISNFSAPEKLKRRLSTSSSDSIFIINDEKFRSLPDTLTMETSYYDFKMNSNNKLTESTIVSETTENLLNKSMSELTCSSKENINQIQEVSTNNLVEFYSDQIINDSDLEVLMLFLENVKQSGGGDSIEHSLDHTRRLLIVKYESYLTKKRVLSKHIFDFKINTKNFKIIANEPLDKTNFKIDNSVIILRNVKSNIDDILIRIYAENLVVNDDENNDVEKISSSMLFKDTFYIKYKTEFDFEKLKKRIQKRPKLHDSTVNFLQAYKTNIVLVKQYDSYGQRVSKDLIEMYFSNKKRCGSDSYSSVHERDPFLLVTYDNYENFNKVLEKKHDISKHELIIEGLYNFDLLEKELENYQKHHHETHSHFQPHEHKKEEMSNISLNESSLNKTQEKLFEEPKIDHEQEIFKPPFIKLNAKQDPRLKILYDFDDLIFDEFKNELSERQADVTKLETQGEYEIKIECNEDLPTHGEEYKHVKQKWEKEILVFLENFFDQFGFKEINIKNAVECLKLIDNDQLRIKFIKLDSNKDDSLYEIIGFKELVDKALIFINNQNLRLEKKEAEIIDEQIYGLKLYQIRVLFINKYIRQLKDKYKNLDVVINPKKCVISLKGTRSQIEDAKDLKDKILNSICNKVIPADKIMIRFFEKKEPNVVNWLIEKNVLCVLMPDSTADSITIYSTDINELEKCSNLIKNDIKTQELSKNLYDDIDSSKIQNFLDRNSDEPGVILEKHEQHDTIKLCGFTEQVDMIFHKFLEEII